MSHVGDLLVSVLVSVVVSLLVSRLVIHLIFIRPIKAEGRRARKAQQAEFERQLAAIRRGEL